MMAKCKASHVLGATQDWTLLEEEEKASSSFSLHAYALEIKMIAISSQDLAIFHFIVVSTLLHYLER